MVLRRNSQTGQWERQQGDQWVPAEPPAHVKSEAGTLDAAIADAFGDLDAPSDGTSLPTPPEIRESSPPSAAPVAVADSPAVGPVVNGAGPAAGDPAADGTDGPGLLVDDIPGLTSTDGPRSSAGTRGVRTRLQSLAQRGKGKRVATKVVVGPRSARASGPAVKEGTAARQAQRSAPKPQVSDNGAAQRYINRPAPGLLSAQPKWVQELFEAHFRSDYTLALRKENNRMKISRQDYAIGWLTLLQKIKEDPSIARLKKDA